MQKFKLTIDKGLTEEEKDLLWAFRKGKVIKSVPRYEYLINILASALDQASSGKGKERHADANLPFEEQDIVKDSIYCGQAGPIYQIRKKAKESLRLSPDKAIQELLGCIIYSAAAIIALEKKV
jgi:hypothetical protein